MSYSIGPGQCVTRCLGEALRKFGNGAGPKRNQRIRRVIRIALKITAKFTGAGSGGERVVRQGEMIKSDGRVARVFEFFRNSGGRQN